MKLENFGIIEFKAALAILICAPLTVCIIETTTTKHGSEIEEVLEHLYLNHVDLMSNRIRIQVPAGGLESEIGRYKNSAVHQCTVHIHSDSESAASVSESLSNFLDIEHFLTRTRYTSTLLIPFQFIKSTPNASVSDHLNFISLNTLKYSLVCQTTAVVVPTYIGPNYIANFIKLTHSLNNKPDYTNYVFLGEVDQIKKLFLDSHSAVLRLMHKTGVVLPSRSAGSSNIVQQGASKSHSLTSQSVQILKETYSRSSGWKMKFQPLLTEQISHRQFSTPKMEENFLNSQHIMIGMFSFMPHVVFGDARKPIDNYGSSLTLVRELGKKFNFTFQVEFAAGNIDQLPNGTWNGFIGDVVGHRKELFFVFVQTAHRDLSMDFTTYLACANLVFYTAHPKVTVKWEAIFYPFSSTIWILIGISFVCVIPVIYFSLKFERRRRKCAETETEADIKNKTDQHSRAQSSALYHAIALPLSALVVESVSFPFQAREIMILFSFYATIIGSFFNSNLISYLTFPDPEDVPKTFAELAARKDYTVKLMNIAGSIDQHFFSEAQLPVYVEINRRIEYERNFLNCTRSAIYDPKTACIAWRTVLEPLMARNFTIRSSFAPLRKSNAAMSPYFNAAAPKHSKYLSYFNSAIRWARDTGNYDQYIWNTVNYMKEKGGNWLRSQKNMAAAAGQRSGSSGVYESLKEMEQEFISTQVKPLGLKNFGFCFAVMIVGGLVGSLGFFVECIRKLAFLKERMSEKLIRMQGFNRYNPGFYGFTNSKPVDDGVLKIQCTGADSK